METIGLYSLEGLLERPAKSFQAIGETVDKPAWCGNSKDY